MTFLIPSEAISPFAGYLVSQRDEPLRCGRSRGFGEPSRLLDRLLYFIGLWDGRELWAHYGR